MEHISIKGESHETLVFIAGSVCNKTFFTSTSKGVMHMLPIANKVEIAKDIIQFIQEL